MKKSFWAALLCLVCAGSLVACRPAPKYEISVQDVQNGLITVSSSEASAGKEIQITCTPDEGYVLKEGTLKVNGVPVEGDSFIMPKCDAVITVEFIPTDSE